MSSYDLIKDLEKKLSLYRDTHKTRVASPNIIHQNTAHYIALGEIYPRPLNRENVKALLEGRDSWLTVEGNEFSLAYRVDVAELEQARIIGFPSDSLAVRYGVSASPNMPTKLRHQLIAHSFLYQIRYENVEFAFPHLRLAQDAIDPVDMPFVQQSIKPCEGSFRLSIRNEEVSGIGTFLWKRLLNTACNPDAAFAEYVAKMSLAAGHVAIFDIDFDLDIDVRQFLECAYTYAIADQSLFDDWEDCAADVAINHHRPEVLTKKRIRKVSVQRDHDRVCAEQYADALDPSHLDDIVRHLTSLEPATLLEAGKWWDNASDYRFASRETVSGYLIYLIIRHEQNLYSGHNSFPVTRKLIKLSQGSPKLLAALFTHSTIPAYVCFLLSQPDINHIGLINVYRCITNDVRPISYRSTYEKTWNDLVWTQALEIFQSAYDQNFPESDIGSAVDRLCEMIAWFASHEIGYNSRITLISETRLPSLRYALENIHYLGESYKPTNLVIHQRRLFIESVQIRLTLPRVLNECLPLGEWLILLWSLDWAEMPPTSQENLVSDTLQACDVLTKSYLTHLNQKLAGNAIATDEPLAFDQLDWRKVYNKLSSKQKNSWLNALKTVQPVDLIEDVKKSRDIIFAARLHCRLLLQLSSLDDPKERRKIVGKLLEIVDRFGFGVPRHSGLFNYLNDNSDFKPVKLWQDVTHATIRFTPKEFSKLIEILRRTKAPLNALFVLLESTASHRNRELILTLIAARNLEEASSDWTPEAFDIILKAANNGQMKIAKEYLRFVKKHAHKTFNNKTIEISAKLELKEIFDNKKLSLKTKLRRLGEYSMGDADRQVVNEVESFNKYLFALLTIDEDHARALTMFTHELERQPTLQNATGLIRVVISWPESTPLPASPEHYFRQWLKIYEATFESDLKATLSDAELINILQLCLITDNFKAFQRFWDVASDQQRDAYEFAEVIAEFLKRTAGIEAAYAYLQDLRAIHGTLPSDALSMFAAIENRLKTAGGRNFKPQPTSAPKIYALQDKLRNAWQLIKELDAFDQSQIFMAPTKKIDNYLIELVEHVGLELLKRNGNLQRKGSPSARSKVMRLDEENMINDWFVSLVSQRMSFVGWTMQDQSRMGRSETQESVGESDGWVRDGRSNPVFLFEAFRLDCLKKSTINTHLNKLRTYNSMGMPSIFVVVYAACNNFSRLCSGYKSHVETLDYQGFDTNFKTGLQVRESKIKSTNAMYFQETRKINGVDVTIYHHILHFKPPQ